MVINLVFERLENILPFLLMNPYLKQNEMNLLVVHLMMEHLVVLVLEQVLELVQQRIVVVHLFLKNYLRVDR